MPSLPCTWAQVGDPNPHCQSRPNAGFIRHPCRSPAWRCRLARRHRRSLKVTNLLLFFFSAQAPRRCPGGTGKQVAGPTELAGPVNLRVGRQGAAALRGRRCPTHRPAACPAAQNRAPAKGSAVPPFLRPRFIPGAPGVVGHSAPSTGGRSHTPSPTRHAQAPPSPSRRRPLRRLGRVLPRCSPRRPIFPIAPPRYKSAP